MTVEETLAEFVRINSVSAGSDAETIVFLAARPFDSATRIGAQSIHAQSGELEPGRPADFFAVDVDDPSIAGASMDDLLACILFSLARTAVREVFIGGRAVVEEGQHRAQREIVENFAALQHKLWGKR